VSYRTSTTGIVAVMAGMSLSVQDGLGGTDTVSRVHVLNDSLHDDSITVDSNYQTSFGTFFEVRLSSGDDTVEFIGFAGRIAYVEAGGGVRVDLELGTATDVNFGDGFIGNDTFIGQVGLLRGSSFDDVLLGSSGNDSFRGHGGDDFIDGRGGTNTIQFAGASFGVHVDLSQNTVFADGHWYAAEGRYGIDDLANIHNVRGSEFADLISGDDGVNDVRGGTGGDILLGGLGGDTLQGGEGIDRFVYRSPDDGGDTIIDFAVSEDVLVIDAAAFGGGLIGGQALNGSQLVSGNAPIATEAHGQFLYDTASGDLWWDGDGTGAQAAVHIASLNGTPALTAADFRLVPVAGALAVLAVGIALSGAFARLIGATVFATPEEFIRSPAPRHIPSTWARIAVLDVDQARIGITWTAHDRTGDVATVYDCVVMPRGDLALLAATLRDRGAWIPVLMDAEARKRPRDEGLRIAERLSELGTDIYCAHADTGTTVEEIANRLSTGRLRVHDHLEEWFAGYRRYRRDERGEIVETDDHLIRATGLMLVHGLGLAITENRAASEAEEFDSAEDERMSGRLGVTGY
jgi:hypothetical protein